LRDYLAISNCFSSIPNSESERLFKALADDITTEYNTYSQHRFIDLYYIEDPKVMIGGSKNSEVARNGFQISAFRFNWLKSYDLLWKSTRLNNEWKESLSNEQIEYIVDMFKVPNTIPITPHLLGNFYYDMLVIKVRF